MYAQCYKKYPAICNNMSWLTYQHQKSCWLNVQQVSISTVVIIRDLGTNTIQLVCKQTHSYKMKLSWVVLFLMKVSTPVPRLNTYVTVSATLRGRMCYNTQSRSSHKNSDSHSIPVQRMSPLCPRSRHEWIHSDTIHPRHDWTFSRHNRIHSRYDMDSRSYPSSIWRFSDW
jgi:hypothetical protein